MNTPDKPSSTKSPRNRRDNFLRRIDIRFPWLKLGAVLLLGTMAILDVLDVTIPKVGENSTKILTAPMQKHVRAVKRDVQGKMLVALTFDDGPSADTTPALLDILHAEDVPATFFMLGSRARSNPDIVKRIKNEGHDPASHTMYHQNLIRLSASSVQSDINESNAVFSEIIGDTPVLTRPPYGNVNDNVRRIAGTPLILWSVDSLDWKDRNTDSILSVTMSEIHDGAIILMHDIYPTTVEAISPLIKTLRGAGYEFTTVTELAKLRGVNLNAGTVYYNFRP